MRRCENREFESRPWRIHEVVGDFRVEDVWSLPLAGAGPEDFRDVMAAIRSGGSVAQISSGATGLLFRIRWALGAALGWDRSSERVGHRVASLRDRLPPDLRALPVEPAPPGSPFVPLYDLDDECASEISNRTVHAVMHHGWVRGPGGSHELQVAVLVKPNGVLGRIYLAAITPFRYGIVYPALGRAWEAAWLKGRGARR